MPTNPREDQLLETYARTLLEASKAEGRIVEDMQTLKTMCNASPEVLAVVGTMINRGDQALLPEVVKYFQKEIDGANDIVGVYVTTAVPMDDHLREIITKKCSESLGSDVFLIEEVDPSILGGIVLSARGQRRDVSVRTQLEAARRTLIHPINNSDGGEE